MQRSLEPCNSAALFDQLLLQLDPSDTAGFAQYAADPVRFASEVLGVRLWSMQREILAALVDHPQVTVRSGHGVGKTFTAAVAALWHAYCHRPSLTLTTAPSKRQVEKLLWRTVHQLFHAAPVRLPGALLKTQLDISSEQLLLGFTAANAESGAGFHARNILIIVDEASGIPPDFIETLQGALTSDRARLFLIGNPTRVTGPFAASHRSSEWKKFRLSCLDSPNFAVPTGAPPPWPELTTREWVTARQREWGTDSSAYKVRVLGEFPSAGPDTLIPLEWLDAARERDPHEEQLPVVIGLDVARYGDCETVAAVRAGQNLLHIEAWSQTDLMATADRLFALAKIHGATHLVIDSAGVGAGVVDRALEMQRGSSSHVPDHVKSAQVVAFNGGLRACQPHLFRNQRDESYWGLRLRYESAAVHHAAEWDTYTGQVSQLTFRHDAAARVLIQTKDELRAKSLPSPDWADAVALAFALRPAGRRAPAAIGALRPA